MLTVSALIQGYYISFECEAGVEMTGNLLTVSADMPETWHGSLPAVNHAGIRSAEIFHHANGRDYEVPTVLTNCPFNILPAMGDVNLDGQRYHCGRIAGNASCNRSAYS